MGPNDALFAVRVITDPPNWFNGFWTALGPLFGVAVGACTTYFGATAVERFKSERNVDSLLRALAAELRAAEVVIKMHKGINESTSEDVRNDTLAYGLSADDGPPIARAAATQAGILPECVAAGLAETLFMFRAFRQQQYVITEMRKAGALTDAKFKERHEQLLRPLAIRMIEANAGLLKVVEKELDRRKEVSRWRRLKSALGWRAY